eukprot:Em0949g2a
MSHKYPEAYDSTLELVGVCFKRATQDYARTNTEGPVSKVNKAKDEITPFSTSTKKCNTTISLFPSPSSLNSEDSDPAVVTECDDLRGALHPEERGCPQRTWDHMTWTGSPTLQLLHEKMSPSLLTSKSARPDTPPHNPDNKDAFKMASTFTPPIGVASSSVGLGTLAPPPIQPLPLVEGIPMTDSQCSYAKKLARTAGLPTYKFVVPIRKKSDRDKLDAKPCPDCQKWFSDGDGIHRDQREH